MQKKVGTGPSGGGAASALRKMRETDDAKKAEKTEGSEKTFQQKVDVAVDTVANVGSDIVLTSIGAVVTKNSVDGLQALYAGNHEGGNFSSAEFNYMFGIAMGVGMSASGSLRLVHGLAAHLSKTDDD